MPAGNGVQATNYFANEAKRDGTYWMGGGNAYIDAQAMLRRSTCERLGGYRTDDELIYGWEAYPDDVAPLVHAHPTQNEALGEAHLALAGKPLHAHS